jgi:hypothetical protein
MKWMSPVCVRNIAIVVLLIAGGIMASCGGEGGNGAGLDRGAGLVAAEPGKYLPEHGKLVVTVTDPGGEPVANARVDVYFLSQAAAARTASSNKDGVATFEAVAEQAQVLVTHPLGRYLNRQVMVRQSGTTALSAVLQIVSPLTVALLPVTVPAGGISADRTELALRVTVVSQVSMNFGTNLGLEECSVGCGNGPVQAFVEDIESGLRSDPTLAQQPYSVLLLMEQSRRVPKYDPYGLRTLAARNFIRKARSSPKADLIAVAGFAGEGGDASSPPLLLQLPLWVPPGTTTVFSSERLAQEAALDSLEHMVGGSAPVFGALQAAMSLTAAQVPASGRPSIVALLGGGDDSGVTESQQQAALLALRQKQTDTGIQSILFACERNGNSADRRQLARIAAALSAPVIHALIEENPGSPTDGLYSALDFAADMLAGTTVRSLKAVIRLKVNSPARFISGTTLEGILYLESDLCQWGCEPLTMHFAVEVP